MTYSQDAGEFLVVWDQWQSTDNYDVYGQRLSGSNVALVTAGYDQRWPAVAPLAGAGDFLAVWDDQRGGGWGDLYAQRVDAGGDLVDSNELLVEDVDYLYGLALAGHATAPEVVVAWEENYQIYAQRYAGPAADFSGAPLTGTLPLTVTFTNLSTPTQVITSALWAYGDGVISDTLALTHTHTYTQAGVYTVTLSVSDGVITDTLIRTHYITVSQPLTADFTATPLTGTFTNLSTPTQVITHALWAYGGGVIGNTLALTHTHTYTQAGVYTVTLSVSDGVVTDTLTRTNYITVSAGIGYTTTTRVITYTYDPLYRLTGADYSTGESFAYSYDAAGNRLALTETLGLSQTVHSYQYDTANRLVNVDGQAYTWDANGNLLDDGVRTFAYDTANRLTLVTSGTLTSTFEYDGSGNRVAQTVDGITTEYVLDVASGLPEVIVATRGGASTYYVQIQGQILAQQDAGTWAYVLPDHLGSVRQLVGSEGQVDLVQSYDPFGVPFEASGSGESEFGYTGEWWDAYTDLLPVTFW